MAADLDYGVQINSSSPLSSPNQKYCYGDLASNCTTYGALYSWLYLMNGSASCDGTDAAHTPCPTPVQGICPTGWHVASHFEWVQLMNAVGTPPENIYPYDENQYGNTGTHNEDINLEVGGSSGFNAQFAGWLWYNGSTPTYSYLGHIGSF